MEKDPREATTWHEYKRMERALQDQMRKDWIEKMSIGTISISDLSQKIAMDRGQLQEMIKKFGCRVVKGEAGVQRGTGLDYNRLEKMREYEAQGLTINVIAQREGISRSAVAHYEERHGLKFRRSHPQNGTPAAVKEKPKPKAEPRPETPLERMRRMAREESNRMARVGLG